MTSKDCVIVNEEIHIGEWCLFWHENKLMIGLLLGFARLNGKTYNTREYTRSYATVKCVDSNPIGALCSFYDWDAAGQLHQVVHHPFYLHIEAYKATVKCPDFEEGCLKINDILLNRINDFQG